MRPRRAGRLELRAELAAIEGDALDLLAVEQRVRELINAYGRALMREAMAPAGSASPEVTIGKA